MLTHNPHTPDHLLLDNTPYFSQAQSVRNVLSFNNHISKKHLSNFFTSTSTTITGSFISGSCLITATTCEKSVWWNSWDYCPGNERECLIRINYVLDNPIKPGDTDNLQQAPFSSFHQTYQQQERKYLARQFRACPEHQSLVLHEAHSDNF